MWANKQASAEGACPPSVAAAATHPIALRMKRRNHTYRRRPLSGARVKLKLKLFSLAFPLAIVAFLAVMGTALWLVTSSFKQVERVLQQRQVTLALTSELSRITELLARLVRAHAATGD